MGPGPLRYLLRLYVLQSPLMEADPDCASEPLLLVVTRDVPELLDLDLVALALVDVGQAGVARLGQDGGGRGQDVLEPALTLQVLGFRALIGRAAPGS